MKGSRCLLLIGHVLLFLFIVGCGRDAHSPRESALAPVAFKASITQFRAPSVVVEMRDARTIVYRWGRNHAGDEPSVTEEAIPITSDQWTRFRAHIDAAKVRGWSPAYRDPQLADGSWWEVHLRYDDFEVTSMGSNMYPPDGVFDEFTRAVHELIGPRAFP